MNSVGKRIKLTFFGESHNPSMGFTLDQCPPGIKIDENLIQANLEKRKPEAKVNTSRVEPDDYEWISGLKDGITTGAPLTCLVKNQRMISKDYPNLNQVPRPSHADYPAFIKYKGFNDYRGGGMFSGRLTVLWVIAGSIAEQILTSHNIYIGSHILSIHKIYDEYFNSSTISKTLIESLNGQSWPLLNKTLKEKMQDKIMKAKVENDSLGGIIETAAINLPVGLGSPLFHSVESYLSYLLFSIPGIKGVEFGSGFDITKMYGSESIDEYTYENGYLKTKNNHNGGVVGGLTNGQPLIVRTAIKPIPSINQMLESVDLKTKENTHIQIKGRHDPQVVSRVHPVINAVISFGILDLLLMESNL